MPKGAFPNATLYAHMRQGNTPQPGVSPSFFVHGRAYSPGHARVFLVCMWPRSTAQLGLMLNHVNPSGSETGPLLTAAVGRTSSLSPPPFRHKADRSNTPQANLLTSVGPMSLLHQATDINKSLNRTAFLRPPRSMMVLTSHGPLSLWHACGL